MIHHFYVGHFEKDRGAMKLQKRSSDGAPRPVLVRSIDMAIVRKLLEEKGVNDDSIPEDWWLGFEEEGFIVCNAHTRSQDAIDFIGRLARKTGCDVLYDGMLAIAPDKLTIADDALARESLADNGRQ